MFDAPELIEAEVVARLPDRFRIQGRDSELFPNRRGVDCFLEGPSFDVDGNLFVVDFPWGRIFRMSPAGEFALVAEYDGWPSGLKISESGDIHIADHKRGILRLDLDTGTVTPLVTKYRLEGFKGGN